MIFSLFGPNWVEQLINDYCDSNPPWGFFFQNPLIPLDLCDMFTEINVGPIADGTDDEGSINEVGLKLLRHIAQIYHYERFQKYSNYSSWSSLYPVEDIDVPIFLVYSEVDKTCPPVSQDYTLSLIPTVIDEHDATPLTHEQLVGNNSDDFVDLLLGYLDYALYSPIDPWQCLKFRW